MTSMAEATALDAIPSAPPEAVAISARVLNEIVDKIAPGQCKPAESMSRHTTLRMGGPADIWFEPQSRQQLRDVVSFCFENKVPVNSVGGGSNLLVRDGGIRGVVLSTKRLREVSRDGSSIRVEAGLSTGKLLSLATKWELGGVEFLGGVPGSIGGGMVMNAGTYLGEFKDVTKEVTSIDLVTGEAKTRSNEECGFAYRNSALPKSEVVVEAVLDLQPRAKTEIETVVRALRDRRKEREPQKVSNAGSAFKNPKDDYAGRLIEDIGFKGRTIGQAQCSPAHANWFVNLGGARTEDMLALLREAWTEVKRVHSVELELEWKLVGNDAE